jgi:hypothetical protein
MTRMEKFFVNFHEKAILLAQWLLKYLLGPLPGQNTDRGRLHKFILFALHWRSLFIRFGVSLAAALIFYRFELSLLAKLSFLAAELYLALFAILLVARVVSYGRSFLVSVAAMWLPILVIIVAVAILFMNDQGQELGVGLMDPDDYHKALLLAAALVYWALNNWLSARIGLAKCFRKPRKDQGYLFWGPRLLGVCAHLIAALSLSFAIYFQPDPKMGIDWLLVLSAPLTIVLATIFAWSFDWAWLSHRFERNSKVAWGITVVTGLLVTGLWCWLGWRSFHTDAASGTSESPSPEAGLRWTALCISISALTFLIFISKLRQNPPLEQPEGSPEWIADQHLERSLTVFCALVLGAVMICGTAAIWISPMTIGQYFGSLTVVCFSFGSFLALTNMVDLFAAGLSSYARRKSFRVRPRAIFGTLLALAILPAVVASLTQAFHKVRICDGKCVTESELKDAPVKSPDMRPDVAQAALAWYGQAAPAYHALHAAEEPVPLFIVATAGGGIRAAYWTATILQTLDRDLNVPPAVSSQEKRPKNLMRNLLFAISGVSGGSVGAAAYAAAVRNHELNQAEVEPTKYLKEDFLAPGIAAMVFIDGLATFLPDMGEIDRGGALELGFEAASQTTSDKDGLLSHKFLNFSPPCDIAAKKTCDSWRPLLLLNATHQETGRRIITSHVKVERNVFYDSYDALQVLNSDVRLSTAAHNSARFFYVSPAGNLISATTPLHNRGYILDGGYYEAYGAETALELARKAIDAIDPEHGRPGHKNLVKLVILQISSDPGLKDDRTLVRAKLATGKSCTVSTLQPATALPDHANYLEVLDAVGWQTNEGEHYVLPTLNELTAPLAGIISVRGSHGTVAMEELAASICRARNEGTAAAGANDSVSKGDDRKIDDAHFAHLAMCESSGIIPPLGWVLAEHTRAQFKGILNQCDNPMEMTNLKAALGVP